MIGRSWPTDVRFPKYWRLACFETRRLLWCILRPFAVRDHNDTRRRFRLKTRFNLFSEFCAFFYTTMAAAGDRRSTGETWTALQSAWRTCWRCTILSAAVSRGGCQANWTTGRGGEHTNTEDWRTPWSDRLSEWTWNWGKECWVWCSCTAGARGSARASASCPSSSCRRSDSDAPAQRPSGRRLRRGRTRHELHAGCATCRVQAPAIKQSTLV